MADLVFSDLCFTGSMMEYRSRQVKVQPPGCDDPYSCAQWVVAIMDDDLQPAVVYLSRHACKERVRISLDPLAIDLGPHASFCRGEMPPGVYADWLEENEIDLPEQAFRVLRWQTR